MKYYNLILLVLSLLNVFPHIIKQSNAIEKQLIILSASSTTELMEELTAKFISEHNISIKLSIASSGILAKQVKLGIPANIFISASPDWIEKLKEENKIDYSLTKPIFRNSLVLIKNNKQKLEFEIDLKNPDSILKNLYQGKLVIGDPSFVPAGKYAKNYLKEFGIWGKLKHKVIKQVNARSILNILERNEAKLGIVYLSDLNISKNVDLVKLIPEKNNKIIYHAAVILKQKNNQTIQFYNFLSTEAAKSLYKKYGFKTIN